jgi:hypothetical protein
MGDAVTELATNLRGSLPMKTPTPLSVPGVTVDFPAQEGPAMPITTTTSSTGVTVERHKLPPIPAPKGVEIDDYDIYVTGPMRRAARRDCAFRLLASRRRHRRRHVEVSFEARINGLREDGCGFAEIYTTDPNELADLTEVAFYASRLLIGARQS